MTRRISDTGLGMDWLHGCVDRAAVDAPGLVQIQYRGERAAREHKRGRVAVLRAAALREIAEQLLQQARQEIASGLSLGVSQAEAARLTSLSRQRLSQLAAEARAHGWQVLPGGAVQTPLLQDQ